MGQVCRRVVEIWIGLGRNVRSVMFNASDRNENNMLSALTESSSSLQPLQAFKSEESVREYFLCSKNPSADDQSNSPGS